MDNVSLEVSDKELFVLLGPSGSGKSTILRIIAGLTNPTGGRVLLHDRDVTNLPPQQRGIGFVFQNYSIFRHMTIHGDLSWSGNSAGRASSRRASATGLALIADSARQPARGRLARAVAVSSRASSSQRR